MRGGRTCAFGTLFQTDHSQKKRTFRFLHVIVMDKLYQFGSGNTSTIKRHSVEKQI